MDTDSSKEKKSALEGNVARANNSKILEWEVSVESVIGYEF